MFDLRSFSSLRFDWAHPQREIALRASTGAAIGLAGAGLLALATGAPIVPTLAAAVIAAAATAVPLFHGLADARRRLAEKPKTNTTLDPLTNCLSRGTFLRRFDDLALDAGDDNPTGGALLLVRADHLRAINDSYGNDAGDDVLCALASTIRASVRATDFVGRLDGGEFGVFLRGASPKQAVTVADRIRRNIGQLRVSEEIDLSISVGGAVFASSLDADELMRFANRSLDAARDSGKDKVEMIYVPTSGDPVLIAGSVH